MNTKTILSAAILSVLSAGAMASESSRWSGELIFGSGFKSTNSNLSVESDALLSDNTKKGNHNEEFIGMVLGNVAYDLGENRNQRFYMGTSRDDLAVGDLAFEIGYQFDMQNGTQIDIAYLPTVLSGEVWQNPYLEGRRKETDIEGHAYRLQFNNIWGSGFSLDMAYATTEIEHERVEYAELLRDSEMYYIKGSYTQFFTPQMGLMTSVGYVHNDADGEAQTYDQYELEMTYFVSHNAHTFAVTGGYAYREYEGYNPIYSKTREDHRHMLFLAYEYANIGGWDNWSLVSFAGINVNDTNIDFYTSDDYLATIGLSYKF
ncbi:DUF2860 domain-containing protein [Shewanella sp. Scap07]|uniref:DUF2860 family protein n=1 Tax=Shewanella sp. Scap07 TaxID=2589987 RepID=UPI0015BA5BEE|nr:DUF2860 family protein [Shewanella sp. Scap07]QLE87413.1 DUF2860 domain-containing protein [Shewanella sp. Scap07]